MGEVWESVRGRCGKVCWGEWKMWERVLGCGEEVWKSGGSGKVFWVWGKVKRGVGKCVEVRGK